MNAWARPSTSKRRWSGCPGHLAGGCSRLIAARPDDRHSRPRRPHSVERGPHTYRMRIWARATVAVAAVAVAVTGCAKGGTSSAAPAGGTAPAGSTVQEKNCTAGYCDPADWDTALASTPLKQIPAFGEPLNVIISARSTVSLGQLQQALGNWKTVSTATTVSVTGIHIKCISSENADVTGGGYEPQHAAWRLG